MSTVVYLYGFVPAGAAPPGGDVIGLDGRAVRVLELGAFAAAVSDVDARDYGEGALEARLKDLAWVAQRGARHELVVTWFSDHASIVPARLLTVFSSEEALRAEASRREADIRASLRRLRDLREWDLKVSYDLDALAGHLGELSQATAALDADIARAAPGRRYLLERRRAELAREEAGGVVRGLARDVLEKLRPLAEEASELEHPLVEEDVPVVLNAALLVRKDRTDELERAAQALRARLGALGVHVALTGPWAPYRFVGEKAHA